MDNFDLARVLVKEAVILDRETFKNKEEMFDFMASKFVESGIVTDKIRFIDSLHKREDLGSTYMGNFIGLPHGKCEEVITPGIGLCRCKKSFIYESNGEKGEVKYIFMLAIAGSQTGDQYMRVLATLAGLLTHDEFLAEIDKANNYEEILSIMKKY